MTRSKRVTFAINEEAKLSKRSATYFGPTMRRRKSSTIAIPDLETVVEESEFTTKQENNAKRK
ncbi:unnamed protein product [Nippostrongylus brasiliensis]|uniref:Uncharacterized protein n=1 Tax=Nippostrongylus brasiliensis TaxID=27835 RepID=A0A0N4YJX9_NIPBR|nr:unnamed protein product [Nippostrongylus brasiliensis]